MLLPHPGFKKTFESVSDAPRQRESGQRDTAAETGDAEAGRAMFGFFGGVLKLVQWGNRY